MTPSTTTQRYTTRAVVYRPIDPKKFNGTVIVEWLNVSGGVDANPDWTLTHNELIRDGFAWVGVSAQAIGVNQLRNCPIGGPVTAACPGPGDPVRYASLSHPGDSYSYDIFSQAGQAVRDQSALILGGLTPKKIIAAGESQSASRLVTYIDAVHPLVTTSTTDSSCTAAAARASTTGSLPTSPTRRTEVTTPFGTMIRNDLDVPVFVFETETDVFNSNTTDRQPDTNRFRLWEVAGSSHFDWYGLAIGPTDTGDGQGAVANLAAMQNPSATIPGGLPPCAAPINTGGTHWVLNAAVYSLNQWVVNGIAPPIAPSYLHGHFHVPGRVHQGRERQHGGGSALTTGRCTNRRVRRHRPGAVILLPLRHHGSFPVHAARRALQEPRTVRVGVEQRHPEARERRVPAPA